MATWDDVRRLALALPETDEVDSRGVPSWRVAQKGFIWERPLNKSDLKKLKVAGEDAPDGPILAAQVEDEGIKSALIASNPDVYFTIAHFNGYPAVLVLLDNIDVAELDELVTDAWLARAPKRLAQEYLRNHHLPT